MESCSWFGEPSIPIPTDVTRLTGITADMVAGHAIDVAEVERFIAGADLPPAFRDLLVMLAATSGGIAALDSDNLPAGFADVLGSRAGLTVVLADGPDAAAREMPRIDAHIADVGFIGRDVEASWTRETSSRRPAQRRGAREGHVRPRPHSAAGLAPIGEAMLGAALAVDAADWGICPSKAPRWQRPPPRPRSGSSSGGTWHILRRRSMEKAQTAGFRTSILASCKI